MNAGTATHRPHLIYLIGASGVGKDSLLDYLRSRLPTDGSFRIARRWITRPHDGGRGEDHQVVSEPAFAEAVERGDYVLHWDSHGYRYGIHCEIHDWLREGCTVIVNGSREYLPEAAKRFPELLPVLVTVSADTLRGRLEQRGRETADQIERRLTRAASLQNSVTHPALIRLDNNGPLESAGEKLLGIIRESAGAIQPARVS